MRRTAYRIAHFGDLHLKAVDAEFEWTLDMVEHAFERGANHVVFTGDIVDAAEVDVIEDLVRQLERRGHGPQQFSLVPGNHDIYPLSWPPTLRGVVATGLRRSESNWKRILKLVKRNLRGVSAGALFDDEPLPYAKHLAPGVVLVGLDSTRSLTKLATKWATGQLDDDAVDAVAEHVASLSDITHCVVAMHHYPLNDFESASRLFPMEFCEPGAGIVRNWLQHMGATSVLCGHIHESRERRVAGGITVLATDSNAYDVDEDQGTTGRAYRLVTLNGGGAVSSRLVEVNE